MRFLSSNTFNLCLLGVLTLTGCTHKKDPRPTPDKPLLPDIAFKAIPKATPVHLAPDTVDQFADWVATMPSSQVGDVRQEIARAGSDPKLVDAIASRLSFHNPRSYGYQLIYLSMLGELKNERALSPLVSYLNARDCPVFEERAAFQPRQRSPQTSIFDSCAGLKSHAVSMVAYLHTPASEKIVLDAMRRHSSRTVRLSAINAFLYNNHDSPDAMTLARAHVRPEEAKFIGLPRLTADTDRREFAARLDRFYQEHPEERPPALQRAPGKGKTAAARP